MFRKIAEQRPTLLLDEVDAIFANSENAEALRGILNAGNRPGACGRAHGRGRLEPHDRSTSPSTAPRCSPASARDRWPDTILDRSIRVTLKRKKKDEVVARFRYRKALRRNRGAAHRAGGLGADAHHRRSTTPSPSCPTSSTIARPRAGRRCSRSPTSPTRSSAEQARRAAVGLARGNARG